VTEPEDQDPAATSGVKQVGAPGRSAEPAAPAETDTDTDTDTDTASAPSSATSSGATARTRAADRTAPPVNRVLAIVAALGLIGTVVFGVLWLSAPGASSTRQSPAVVSATKKFLTDFFNFDAKTIDTDFSSITAMATGNFSSQANEFFNTSIRTELEKALAESRGQNRYIEVQTENTAQTQAQVYAVVDQLYVNDKIATPQSDVVRLIINLTQVRGSWKISNVTVLEGPTPASTGTASGSAGSSVPGQ
jgi:hypothetical protein